MIGNRQGGHRPTQSLNAAKHSEGNRQKARVAKLAKANGATRRYKIKNDGKIYFARQFFRVYQSNSLLSIGANDRTPLAVCRSFSDDNHRQENGFSHELDKNIPVNAIIYCKITGYFLS